MGKIEKQDGKITVIVVGGGTGGHLSPAIGFCKILKKNHISAELVTDQRCQKYIPKNFDIEYSIIDIPKISYNIVGFLKFSFFLLISLKSTFTLLFKKKPKIIVTCGGYTIIPFIIAGVILRKKIIIHEQNSVFGKANLFAAKFAHKIFTSFKRTYGLRSLNHSKIVISGNPVGIYDTPKKYNKNNDYFTILITAGSQGALIFDMTIPKAIEEFSKNNQNRKIKVIQQIRGRDLDQVKKLYNDLNIENECSEFFHNMDELYSISDLLIARSGAATIFEAINHNLPAIYIPYPHAVLNHQFYNAIELKKRHASWVLDQSNLSKERLSHMIDEIIANDMAILKKAKENLSHLKINTEEIILKEFNKLIDKK